MSLALALSLGADDIDKKMESFEELLGESIGVSYENITGMPKGSIVTKKKLRKAIDTEYLEKYLNSYYRKILNSGALEILNFCLDYKCVFKFDAFRDLFCEEVIPTAVAQYIDFNLNDKDDSAMYDFNAICFDPINLRHFTASSYEYMSPFVYLPNIDNKVILFSDMTKQDIKADVEAAARWYFRTKIPLELKFHGYEKDKRELWEIPEVQKTAVYLKKLAFLSFLHISPRLEVQMMMNNNPSIDKQGFFDPSSLDPSSFGSFEIWAISKGADLANISEDEFLSLWQSLSTELPKMNKIAEMLYEKKQ